MKVFFIDGLTASRSVGTALHIFGFPPLETLKALSLCPSVVASALGVNPAVVCCRVEDIHNQDMHLSELV